MASMGGKSRGAESFMSGSFVLRNGHRSLATDCLKCWRVASFWLIFLNRQVQVTPLPSRLVLLDINQIKTKDLEIKSRSLLKEFIFFLDIPEHWTWVTLKSAEPMCLLDLQDKEGALRIGFTRQGRSAAVRIKFERRLICWKTDLQFKTKVLGIFGREHNGV